MFKLMKNFLPLGHPYELVHLLMQSYHGTRYPQKVLNELSIVVAKQKKDLISVTLVGVG